MGISSLAALHIERYEKAIETRRKIFYINLLILALTESVALYIIMAEHPQGPKYIYELSNHLFQRVLYDSFHYKET